MTIEELEIDDVQGLSAAEKKATIRNLITAKSGVYHCASNGGDHSTDAPKRGSQKPGEYYLYNNWDFNVAGTIFEKLTGKTIYEAVQNDLAIPIGMEDFKIEKQKKTGNQNKSKHLAYHMWFSTRDMARIGYLMLREGNWNGHQVIPQQWVNEVTRAHTPREQMNPNKLRSGDSSYGYMWWILDNPRLGELYEGAYTASGYFGQHITVIPKLDLVIAHKTKSAYMRRTENYDELRNLIVNTVHDSDCIEIDGLMKCEEQTYEKYLGKYSYEDGYIVEISRDNGVLHSKSKRAKFELRICGKNLYFNSEDNRLMYRFIFGKEKNVTGIVVTYGASMESLTRVIQ